MIHFYLSQFRLSNFLWPKDLALVDNRPCPEAYSALPGSRIARRHCDKDRRRWSGPRVLFSEATKTGPDGHGFGVWYAGICWDIKDIIYIYIQRYIVGISQKHAECFDHRPHLFWTNPKVCGRSSGTEFWLLPRLGMEVEDSHIGPFGAAMFDHVWSVSKQQNNTGFASPCLAFQGGSQSGRPCCCRTPSPRREWEVMAKGRI
jgi:hypothetical protein